MPLGWGIGRAPKRLAAPQLAGPGRRTILARGNDVTNTTAYTTAAIAPIPGSVILLIVRAKHTTTGKATLSVSQGAGLSVGAFVELERTSWNTTTAISDEIILMASLAGSAPGAGTLTFTLSPTQSGLIWEVVSINAVDTASATSVWDTVRQIFKLTSDAASTSVVNKFSVAPDPADVVYLANAVQNNAAGWTVPAGSGYTKDFDQGSTEASSYDLMTAVAEYGAQQSVTTTAPASAVWGSIGVEFYAPGVPKLYGGSFAMSRAEHPGAGPLGRRAFRSVPASVSVTTAVSVNVLATGAARAEASAQLAVLCGLRVAGIAGGTGFDQLAIQRGLRAAGIAGGTGADRLGILRGLTATGAAGGIGAAGPLGRVVAILATGIAEGVATAGPLGRVVAVRAAGIAEGVAMAAMAALRGARATGIAAGTATFQLAITRGLRAAGPAGAAGTARAGALRGLAAGGTAAGAGAARAAALRGLAVSGTSGGGAATQLAALRGLRVTGPARGDGFAQVTITVGGAAALHAAGWAGAAGAIRGAVLRGGRGTGLARGDGRALPLIGQLLVAGYWISYSAADVLAIARVTRTVDMVPNVDGHDTRVDIIWSIDADVSRAIIYRTTVDLAGIIS